MKIGDKIEMLSTGRIGIILGETKDGWKIDFEDGDKPELVSKKVPMEVIVVKPKPNTKPSVIKKINWNLIAIVAAVVVIGVIVMIILI